MPTREFLTVEGVTKTYGSGIAHFQALNEISLHVTAGEFVAIRGPSGCGKSTLLHILGAMDRPTHGQVWLNERRLDTLERDALARIRRKHIGFVFQAFNLLPTLNVEENVALPLSLDGVAESESRQRAAIALAEVGLQERHNYMPAQLSGGEMQRVAVARALAIEPEVIIADEPTGSLDSSNGCRVLELLANLNESKRITVVMATHSEEAAAYASRTVIVRDGRIEKEVRKSVVPEAL